MKRWKHNVFKRWKLNLFDIYGETEIKNSTKTTPVEFSQSEMNVTVNTLIIYFILPYQ